MVGAKGAIKEAEVQKLDSVAFQCRHTSGVSSPVGHFLMHFSALTHPALWSSGARGIEIMPRKGSLPEILPDSET